MEMEKDKEIDCYVTVTSGMRGYFPVLIGIFETDGKDSRYPDPIQTGMTCKNFKEAKIAAQEWAKAEGIRYEV